MLSINLFLRWEATFSSSITMVDISAKVSLKYADKENNSILLVRNGFGINEYGNLYTGLIRPVTPGMIGTPLDYNISHL